MLSVELCRAARGLLGWSAQELADHGGVGVATIRRFEAGQAVNHDSIERIEATFTAAGVTFIGRGKASRGGGEGVRLSSISPD
jgi:transcriptional regulator with XRE-family HTH domain